MFEHTTEAEARKQILDLVADYCDTFHKKKEYKEGDRIPYASRVYDHSEMVNLVDSSLEFWLTSGRYTDEFEKKLAEYLGVRYCSLVNSGSSANLIAFMALTSPLLGDRRVNRGDEVITVACGFPTTVAPMIQYGAVPVFVDVTIPQYNIDVNMLEEARSEKTKAVMIAHTLGNPFDLRAVKAFCDKYNLWLVEDNCDALGTQYTMEEDGKEVVHFSGTVGDIESLQFLEAIRQMAVEIGREHTLFMHLTLVPYMAASGEVKTKPTQHSVKELLSIGIQPDILICRSDRAVPANERAKIALFCNVPEKAFISLKDVDSIYKIPGLLKSQGLDDYICKRFSLNCPEANLSEWEQVIFEEANPVSEVTIGMVGKYIELPDAYKSVIEALKHGGLKNRVSVNIKLIDSQDVETRGVEILKGLDAILVPGGFGYRGVEGMITTARFARENNIPYLGICLGMQMQKRFSQLLKTFDPHLGRGKGMHPGDNTGTSVIQICFIKSTADQFVSDQGRLPYHLIR